MGDSSHATGTSPVTASRRPDRSRRRARRGRARLRPLLRDHVPIPLAPRPETRAFRAAAASVVPRHIQQEQTLWCWVACALMILESQGIASPPQCEFVNETFGTASCCEDGSSPTCNDACPPDRVESLLSSRDITLARTGPVAFQTIKEQVAAGRPVEVYLSTVNGGHVMVIGGCYEADGQMLVVNDPLESAPDNWAFESLAERGWMFSWMA